jgi:hypothetical protein
MIELEFNICEVDRDPDHGRIGIVSHAGGRHIPLAQIAGNQEFTYEVEVYIIDIDFISGMPFYAEFETSSWIIDNSRRSTRISAPSFNSTNPIQSDGTGSVGGPFSGLEKTMSSSQKKSRSRADSENTIIRGSMLNGRVGLNRTW